jgi:hypothetical protein
MYMYTFMYTHTYMCTFMYMYMYIPTRRLCAAGHALASVEGVVNADIHQHICVYTYTYIHTYIFIYTYAYICILCAAGHALASVEGVVDALVNASLYGYKADTASANGSNPQVCANSRARAREIEIKRACARESFVARGGQS